MADHLLPPAIVVMGVAGSGKTTVGELLAQRLGWEFRDADSFHPAANIAKMTAGQPLTDADRWPWLAAIADWIDAHRKAGGHGVVTCSALKRAYRDRLRNGHTDVRFVHLKGDIEVIGARMAARQHHFMPTALLKSQFDTLEPPAPDERALSISVELEPEQIVEAVVNMLERDTAPAQRV
ncbi:gluconokinase [Terrarubrum flagellatum]|uniref:gluconokinase n=1 Tax=Terrirubrum flagellatum TaxID=2895980 RepID=UPI003145494F